MSEKHLEAVESEFQSGPDCRHCKAKISPPEAMEEHETMCLENDSLRAELAREREKWLEASDAAGKAMLRAESAERTVKAMGEALESAKMSIQLATVKLDFHQNMTDEQKIGEAAKILFSALHTLASLAPSQSAEKP